MGKKLYVGNLPFSATEEELSTKFSAVGTVESAKLIIDRDTGRSKGFGFVEMADDNAAQEAIRGLNETQHGGRPLTVNEAKPRESRGGSRGSFSRR